MAILSPDNSLLNLPRFPSHRVDCWLYPTFFLSMCIVLSPTFAGYNLLLLVLTLRIMGHHGSLRPSLYPLPTIAGPFGLVQAILDL